MTPHCIGRQYVRIAQHVVGQLLGDNLCNQKPLQEKPLLSKP